MEHQIRKYPRTRHVRGSRLQHGDHDLEAVPWSELEGKNLVVEEKMDGANCGISFSEDGRLLLQSRGHYLRGGPREKQFNLFKQWASSRQEEFFCALGSRYVMYGEWLFAKHTFFYDALPHYFMEFDILDTQEGSFLDTHRRAALLAAADVNVTPVKVLYEGTVASVDALAKMVTRSHFITDDRVINFSNAARMSGVAAADGWRHTDPSTDMEGLYVKWEEDGVVKGRYKYVRDSFTSSILDQDEHWVDRPIIQNQLMPGAFEKMFL